MLPISADGHVHVQDRVNVTALGQALWKNLNLHKAVAGESHLCIYELTIVHIAALPYSGWTDHMFWVPGRCK